MSHAVHGVSLLYMFMFSRESQSRLMRSLNTASLHSLAVQAIIGMNAKIHVHSALVPYDGLIAEM